VRIVADTNVFVSGVFFTGPPHQILQAWHDGTVELVVSKDVLREYERVGRRLAEEFPGVDLEPFLELVAASACFVEVKPLPKQVCSDPDDDKFLECALAARCRLVISGDNALVRVSGYRGISVSRPRAFVDQYLRGRR
jgi:uncharacterized protein